MIRVVAVVGLYIFIGNSGILSFGHIAFMSIGAYASAWQTCCPAMKPFIDARPAGVPAGRPVPGLARRCSLRLLTAAVALAAGSSSCG